MEHERLEGRAPVRHDEEAAGRAVGAEGLLDRPAAGDELLAVLECDRRRIG
jgi:hypothetical protein